uniref:C2H2-type domain-containing protein n=1 Tax=Timema douglasi TaxID=61478 RepID=A0A7R8Z9F2_TIMDO|nr:unnamed protein product [Timema douglasi]
MLRRGSRPLLDIVGLRISYRPALVGKLCFTTIRMTSLRKTTHQGARDGLTDSLGGTTRIRTLGTTVAQAPDDPVFYPVQPRKGQSDPLVQILCVSPDISKTEPCILQVGLVARGNADPVLSCQLCPLWEPIRGRIQRELALEADRGFSCGECGKVLRSAVTLRRHVMDLHRVQTEEFWCDICHKCYRTKNSLVVHLCKYHKGKTSVAAHTFN